MIAWIYLLLVDVSAILCGTYLVIHGHPWFAGLCFFLAATTSVTARKKS